MKKVQNDCVACGLPCYGSSCPFVNVVHFFCDECGEEAQLYYYFGRVDDPDIAAVAISIQAETYVDGQPVRREVQRLEVPELLERRGYRYFLLHTLEPGWTLEDQSRAAVAVALGDDGREVGAWDIDNASYTYYG